MRTNDLTYGEDYWKTLDGGAGYKDSVMWEDLSVIVKELFCYDGVTDIGGSIHHLDIGCASGYLTKHLRRRGVDSHGCDLSEYALGQAEEYVQPFVKQWDLVKNGAIPNWSSVGFNLITCFETMEHIPEEHVDAVLQEIYDRLDTGGMALFAICTSDREGWDSDPTHVTIYDWYWWEKKLHALGFKHDNEKYRRVKTFHLFADHGGIFVLSKP